MSGSLLNLLVVIIIAGVALGLINMLLPMPPFVKTLLNIVVGVVLVIYVLQFFGIIATVLPIPKVF